MRTSCVDRSLFSTKQAHGISRLIAVSIAFIAMACSDNRPGADSSEFDDEDAEVGEDVEVIEFRREPFHGDPCVFGDGECCKDDTRALICSAQLPGLDGTWQLQNDAGCPCSSASECNPVLRPPPCDRIPAN